MLGVLVALALSASAAAQPPSLAEVAERERARRAAITDKSKVYTNDDLRGGPGLTTGTTVPTESASPEAPAPTAVDGETPTPDPPVEERDESYWRGRITAARDARERADLLAAALQNRVDGLWADFTARDDPFQRAEIEQARIEAIEELERTREEITRLDQEIRDIQEEARRAGVPPGWLRGRGPL